MSDDNIVLIAGFTPGAMLALASLWFIYGPWISIGVAIGSFVFINLIIILHAYFEHLTGGSND